jgi:hypothetical protein
LRGRRETIAGLRDFLGAGGRRLGQRGGTQRQAHGVEPVALRDRTGDADAVGAGRLGQSGEVDMGGEVACPRRLERVGEIMARDGLERIPAPA